MRIIYHAKIRKIIEKQKFLEDNRGWGVRESKEYKEFKEVLFSLKLPIFIKLLIFTIDYSRIKSFPFSAFSFNPAMQAFPPSCKV